MGFKTREKMNIETGNKIIKYISEKDSEKLKYLFSKEVISTELTLSKDIEQLFDFCDGYIRSYEKISMGMETDVDKEQNTTVFNTKYRFVINDTPYLLYYIYTPKNTYNPKKEGLQSIKIIKEIDADRYFCYWNEMKLGIFTP